MSNVITDTCTVRIDFYGTVEKPDGIFRLFGQDIIRRADGGEIVFNSKVRTGSTARSFAFGHTGVQIKNGTVLFIDNVPADKAAKLTMRSADITVIHTDTDEREATLRSEINRLHARINEAESQLTALTTELHQLTR